MSAPGGLVARSLDLFHLRGEWRGQAQAHDSPDENASRWFPD